MARYKKNSGQVACGAGRAETKEANQAQLSQAKSPSRFAVAHCALRGGVLLFFFLSYRPVREKRGKSQPGSFWP